MALTVRDLGDAIRVDTDNFDPILRRLHAVATAHVTRHAPDAPEDVQDEATIRIVGYLYDQPNAGRSIAYANALRNSGAASLLLPWREHRAGAIGE